MFRLVQPIQLDGIAVRIEVEIAVLIERDELVLGVRCRDDVSRPSHSFLSALGKTEGDIDGDPPFIVGQWGSVRVGIPAGARPPGCPPTPAVPASKVPPLTLFISNQDSRSQGLQAICKPTLPRGSDCHSQADGS